MSRHAARRALRLPPSRSFSTAGAMGLSALSPVPSSKRRCGPAPRHRPLDGARRRYNFASRRYAECFSDRPVPDVPRLRDDALAYLDGFDPRSWYDDPVCSILNGEKLLAPPSSLWITKDSLGRPNGHQYLATASQVDDLLDHVRSYESPYLDLRPQVRRIEEKLLGEYAGLLIGNQCLDFGKQDGVTEMEESVMANSVERRLNDALLEDELSSKVVISRRPIYVSCVSNFTNFLDLFRKTLRSLELGVPCIILGRSHTVQHSHRWCALLVDLLGEEGIDPGMVTYMSCGLDDIKRITREGRDRTGMLHTTCSRELARSIKGNYPDTVSSTGGPNTLVTTEWNDRVADAIRTSAAIECAGQCTALRHAVVPSSVGEGDVETMLGGIDHADGAVEALRRGAFDEVFEGHAGTSPPGMDEGYSRHGERDAYYKVRTSYPGEGEGSNGVEEDVEEYWRKCVVDVTASLPPSSSSPDAAGKMDEETDRLARWLVRHQPISLAVNAPRSSCLDLCNALFERTSLVVTTVGSTDDSSCPPAMTCQARPQDAEVFGEFPPRRTMGDHTVYPVVIPSSTPSYDTGYNPEYLRGLSIDGLECSRGVKGWVESVVDPAARGYCVEILRYLTDATAENPKRGFGTSRTALWGLQRPPLLDGTVTSIRCGAAASFDELAPIFLFFLATNAHSQVEVSVSPENVSLLSGGLRRNEGAGLNFCDRSDTFQRQLRGNPHPFIDVVVESDKAYRRHVEDAGEGIYNVVRLGGGGPDGGDDAGAAGRRYPMPGQFVSLYLPMGHVKSTMAGDDEFVERLGRSEKWLRML